MKKKKRTKLPKINGEIFGTPQTDAGKMVPDLTRRNGVRILTLFNGTTLISTLSSE